MKWAYGIRRKVSAALLLAAIFVLLFVKNMVDNTNVNTLGSSFSSVYEDRLVVESYIYRMSEHLFRKKMMIDSSDVPSSALKVRPTIDGYNQVIRDFIEAYEKTRLTADERFYFEKFKQTVSDLAQLEEGYLVEVEQGANAPEIKRRIDKQFNEASANLDSLSRIQISEGKLLNERSQKIVAGSSLLTQFEIGILIAIGLMIFVLVFESSAIFSRQKQDHRLN